MGRERDGGGGTFAASVAFPMVADFAVPDELRLHRSDHPVAAVRAAHRRGEGAVSREFCRASLDVHGLGLP